MIIVDSEIYLHGSHVDALKSEPKYVKERYAAVARTLTPKPFGIPRRKAAEMISRSLRQLYRVVKRFLEEGIPGLRFKSRRPKRMPS